MTLPAISRQIMALEGEEQDEHRDHGDDRPGHHQFIVLDMLAAERGERDRERVQMLVGKHDQRPHEVIPAAEENEQGERDQHRFSTGRTIRRRISHSLAPSIRAASSNSVGIDRQNCRTRKMPKIPPATARARRHSC